VVAHVEVCQPGTWEKGNDSTKFVYISGVLARRYFLFGDHDGFTLGYQKRAGRSKFPLESTGNSGPMNSCQQPLTLGEITVGLGAECCRLGLQH